MCVLTVMNVINRTFHTTAFSVLLLVLLAACSNTPYQHEPFSNFDLEARAVTQQRGPYTIRASVPGNDEAERLFGVPLHTRGIQAIWMEIENHGNHRARFAPYSIDPYYFPPHEVAYMFRKQFSEQGWVDMESRFFDESLPRYVGAGETVSGYVFTNATDGTKAFNVDIFYADSTARYEHFTFFLSVPGFIPDHAEVDFNSIYKDIEYKDIDVDELRNYISTLPCCTRNFDDSEQGQPVLVFLVADGNDLLRALLRANWKETSYTRDDTYLEASDYLFSRPPDAIFRKKRDKTTERNEIALWVVPVSVNGETVWAAQIKHAIGRRFEIGEQFFGVRLDPDVNDGRNYILQDFWYSQALKQYSWSDSGLQVPQHNPLIDYNNNAWFSDGLRLVLWISGEPVSLRETNHLEWDIPGESRVSSK